MIILSKIFILIKFKIINITHNSFLSILNLLDLNKKILL